MCSPLHLHLGQSLCKLQAHAIRFFVSDRLDQTNFKHESLPFLSIHNPKFLTQGWIPVDGAGKVEKENAAGAGFKWVNDKSAEGRSVTDMEIQCQLRRQDDGTLSDTPLPERLACSYFYLRDEDYFKNMSEDDLKKLGLEEKDTANDGDQDADRKLDELRDWISKNAKHVKKYKTQDEFRAHIEKDMTELVEKLIEARKSCGEYDENLSTKEKKMFVYERQVSNEFIVTERSKKFNKKLDKLLESGSRLIAATMKPGNGSTPLLAQWTRDRTCETIFHPVTTRLVGETPLDALASRIERKMIELKKGAVESPSPQEALDCKARRTAKPLRDNVELENFSSTEVRDRFTNQCRERLTSSLGGVPPDKKIVVVIDGCDKLGDYTTWLPTSLPENVTLVLGMSEDFYIPETRSDSYDEDLGSFGKVHLGDLEPDDRVRTSLAK